MRNEHAIYTYVPAVDIRTLDVNVVVVIIMWLLYDDSQCLRPTTCLLSKFVAVRMKTKLFSLAH